MIEGAMIWRQRGFDPPAAVTAATDEYLESEDSIGEWLADCTKFDLPIPLCSLAGKRCSPRG